MTWVKGAGHLCPSWALSSIIMSTVLFDRTLLVHRIWSPSICLSFIQLTSLPFARPGNAALMSMRSTPVMWPCVQAAWALPTTIAAASMADRPFLLRNCPLLSSTHCSASACGDGFECGHHVGWFRVERGGAACTLVLVYVSIRLSESQ